ncbi:DUF1543 domain-containing protein [Thorsellia anophelis]|uniref:DUF1543 domain-containing protein n=1 Tax=Thorsellia anophelis DSM 18579 TaxID=1123402 RepID=A0A1H9ZA94_9GAMM|nr:protein of unknown function [Thorsellia anophelis DSM 18579]
MQQTESGNVIDFNSKVYVFYIGGSAGKSNIEVHDIQFVVGKTPESCFDTLKQNWYGIPASLHIDGYRELNWADGYQITLSETPSESEEKLFFVNVGAYMESTLAELHAFDFFVGTDMQSVKKTCFRSFIKRYKTKA